MLNIVKDTKTYLLSGVEAQYANCKVLMYDLTNEGWVPMYGKIYAISTTADSYAELRELERQLRSVGVDTIVLGSYNEGGYVGVQYFEK